MAPGRVLRARREWGLGRAIPLFAIGSLIERATSGLTTPKPVFWIGSVVVLLALPFLCLLPRNIGYARAAELLFTARSIDAATADAWGLVNRVVPHDTLMDETMATAAQIAAQPPQALRMAKSLLRQGRDMNFDQMLELSAAMQALAHLTEDHIEGVTAVLEKRPGEFSGN